MAKIRITAVELWPFFDIVDYEGSQCPEIEVEEGTLNRWRSVLADFDMVQAEMRDAVESDADKSASGPGPVRQ